MSNTFLTAEWRKLIMLYGSPFAFLTDQQVASVLLSEGSAVSVHSGSHQVS